MYDGIKEINECLVDHLIDNNNSDISDLRRALNLLNNDEKEIKNIKNEIIMDYENYSNNKEKLNCIILDNKFYDLKWEILLEDSSNKSNEISQIKILVKIIYLNIPLLKEEELNLLFDERSFEEFYEEIIKINKNF